MLFNKHEEEPDLEHNPVLRFLRKHMRVTKELHEHHFFVRLPDASGKLVRYATPLFFALVLIELADLVFAVDSVPAILAITQDPFIVSHLEHLRHPRPARPVLSLAAMIHRFVYLKYALALVLVLHRYEDHAPRCDRQDSRRPLAWRNLRPAGGRHPALPC
ncbi:TerC family protein [Pseudomonas aeruginosa]